jgi:chorismate--pyruvate lyase
MTSFAAPHWLTAADLEPLPEPLRDWLFDQGSLTRRLTALSGNSFQVEPLKEGLEPLRDDECAALGIAPNSLGWVREVYLRGRQQPWVFARSVAAEDALNAADLDLAHLGSRSLGELLFSDQGFARGPLQASRYPVDWLPLAVRHELLWARRSCFRRGALGVLVLEAFLPALWQQLGAR